MIWKALFTLLGFASLVYIFHGYGLPRIAADIGNLGWWTIPLALSFLPTVFCYALAWLLITPELKLSHLWALHRLTLVSVAWNNLSPFVKVLGEPVRLILLGRWLDPKAAARSTVLYNIVHTLGTLCSFFLCSLLLLLFFPVSKGLHVGLVTLVVISPLLMFGLYLLPHLARPKRGRNAKRNRIVIAGFWLRWGMSKIRIFSGRYPARFWAAVGLEVLARFVEGATFYIAFLALHHPVSLLFCGLLDVGRALIDNLFFFIPFQVGSREGGILLLTEHALRTGSEAAVSAAVLYRLVEVFWMGAGYLLWINEERLRKSSA